MRRSGFGMSFSASPTVPTRSTRQRSASCQMAGVNMDPIVRGAIVGDEPLTETLTPDSDLSEFVEQRRRMQKPPRMRSRSSSSSNVDFRFRKEHQVVVGNIPKLPTAEHWIKETFCRFGQVLDVAILCRNPNAQPLAYVTFDSEAAVVRATTKHETPSVHDATHLFNVHPRKHVGTQTLSPAKRSQACHEPIVSNPVRNFGQTYASVILSQCKKRRMFGEVNEWRSAMENFDWKPCAARYLYRTVTMEDYLIEYIVTQASYRGIKRETLGDLARRLELFSGACPSDKIEMMPPSVSGVVCNHVRECGKNYEAKLEELFQSSVDQIKVDETTQMVDYLDAMTPEIAKEKMKEILVEGVFIYFFAKFCHGAKFKIRFQFYQRSEPVRSTIIAVTGVEDINEAILAYFRSFDDIFYYDPSTDDLVMVKDYFDKTCKEDMRPFLNKTAHKHPITAALSQQKSNPAGGFPKYSLFGPPPRGEEPVFAPQLLDQEESRPKPISPPKKPPPPPSPSTSVAEEVEEEYVNNSDFFNLPGVIFRILDDSRGEVQFNMKNDQPAVALFKRKDTYIEAKRMTANMRLRDVLEVGDRVHFTISNNRHGRFNCNYLWKGKKAPTFVERMISNVNAGLTKKVPKPNPDQEKLTKHINDILEPAEATLSITVDPVGSTDVSFLPPSVESVVRDVLREDHRRNILSNPLAIDGVLDHVQNNFKLAEEKCYGSGAARERIKIKMEQEMRILLSKLVAKYYY